MTGPSVWLLLVPDAGAARRVRRLIAERGACSGVVVGAWPELIEWARRAYLLPAPAEDWEHVSANALGELKDAFWSESFQVAPVETAAAVERALVALLSATDPARDFAGLSSEGLAERSRRHIEDLVRLDKSLGERLPPELQAIRALLAAKCEDALHTLRVERVVGVPALTRWQKALVDKLNRDAGGPALDEALGEILKDGLEPTTTEARGALGVLQSRLFGASAEKAPLDASVQWVGVRDFLQEAEVAAGMVQRLLAEEPELKPADIGLLLPDEFEYAVAVEDAFRLAGLALSGLPAERWRRDLGREAVFHFLYCRQKPAPAMALAVCLSSPLMPWSREVGAELAQTVMDGDYDLEAFEGADSEARAMLELLRDGDSEPASLSAALGRFGFLLDGGEELAAHLMQARAAIEQVRAMLEGAREIEWTALRRAVTPKFVTSGEAAEFTREGVTVWREAQEPWRAVRRLIVLGFAQGRYPASLPTNPVFAAEDLAAIRDSVGLPVTLPAEELGRRRARFRRQLAAVTEAVTFTVPRRTPVGEALNASESLVFMHQLYAGPEAAEGLVLELDAAEERRQVRHLALAAPAAPQPPRAIVIEDFEFERDLLALRRDAEGKPKPESPSSLETLMVSGLAWLLKRLEAEPLGWAPESANPLVLGTVAHKVFENLFQPGAALPTPEEIPRRVEALLDEVLKRLAPFLRGSQWSVERRNFAALTTKAAVTWRDTLAQLGAEVLASEAWLKGEWSGIAVHGQTDLILGLPGDRLLVVDYKRSSSRKRLTQMQKGFDSQASLYRAMIASGGPKDPRKAALAARLRGAQQTGVVYYLLNDQVALSDTVLAGAAAVPGWRVVEGDIAGEALARIGQRIAEVRSGKLALNRAGDQEFFEKKAGLTPYALQKSPLIALFSLPDEETEAGEEAS